jgi:hypothetical protein
LKLCINVSRPSTPVRSPPRSYRGTCACTDPADWTAIGSDSRKSRRMFARTKRDLDVLRYLGYRPIRQRGVEPEWCGQYTYIVAYTKEGTSVPAKATVSKGMIGYSSLPSLPRRRQCRKIVKGPALKNTLCNMCHKSCPPRGMSSASTLGLGQYTYSHWNAGELTR